MIKLEDGEFLDLLPDYYKSQPDVQALSYAFKRAVKKTIEYAKRLRLYSDIDHMPEELLDYMAIESRIQYYSEKMDLETKRKLIKKSIAWHMKAGTVSATEELIKTAFGEGQVVEWMHSEDGDMEPGVFDIVTSATASRDIYEQFNSAIKRVKSLTAHLRYIVTEHDVGTDVGAAMAVNQCEETEITNDIYINHPEQAHINDLYIGVCDAAEGRDLSVVQMRNEEQEFRKNAEAGYILLLCQETQSIIKEE